MAEPMLIAKSAHDLTMLPQMSNRHGLIAGATGTGKTVSLQVLAENFSRLGVPVFMADVKGDIAGMSQAGKENPKIKARLDLLKITDFPYQSYPVVFWDIFGQQGHPVRATVSEMGPLLLARILNLNEVQQGVLAILFKIADDNGLLLLDLKDLRTMLQHMGENASKFTTQYGNISTASVGAIQRGLLELEQQGGDKFFGEPALNFDDWMQTDSKGRGQINILAADKLMQAPRLYSTFLLWMLSELYENLPEIGDPEKPKLVFFFDEAHLLFTDAPTALMQKIELVIRLVRSKGVGVYFVTQNPLDVPDIVLGQLGNRVQHALRSFTPRDQKAVQAAAETFRTNAKLDVVKAITELGVGEALVSFLDPKGTPGIVERAYILPPHSQIGAITPEQRQAIIQASTVFGQYEKTVDQESAHEILKGRAEGRLASAEESGGMMDKVKGTLGDVFGEATGLPTGGSKKGAGGTREGFGEAMIKSASRAIGSQIGRSIIRGVLGSILGGRGKF